MGVQFKQKRSLAIENIPMTPQRHFRLITFLLLILAAFFSAYAQEAPLNGFDDYVNKALCEWEVPGVAIANRFSIEGAPAGFFVQFEITEGKVKSLTMIQGSGPSLVLLPKQQ